MKRQTPLTKQEVLELQAFALSIGLAFARDTRTALGRRRTCIHEAGHAVIYLGLGLTEWRIELQHGGAETFVSRVAVPYEGAIFMALGGPIAEESLCGPKGVFMGALDDIWQVKDASALLDLAALRTLVERAREAVAERKLYVLALADVLDKNGTLSGNDIEEVEALVASGKYGAVPEALDSGDPHSERWL
jgi:hypothetical protein